MLDGIGDFVSELKRTNKLLSRRVSYRHMFLLGIVEGIGSAIGATIIAGIAIALLLRFVNFLDIPAVNQYSEVSPVKTPIDYQNSN